MSIIDDWIGSVIGTALDPDGHYGNQCVDAVDHYGQFIFGVPWPQCVGAVSGARQLLDAAPDEFWTRIDYSHGFIPQRGDVLVYGGDQYNSWGHTAVTEAATNTYIDVLQQDGFGAPLKDVDGGWYSDKPAHRARLAYSQNGTGPLKGVLRPRAEKLKAGGLQLNSESITPVQEDDMGYVDDLSDEAAAKIARHVHDLQVDREGGGTNTLRWSLSAEAQRTEGIISRTAEATARLILNWAIARGGDSVGGVTTPASVFAYFDQFRVDILNAVGAQIHDVPGLDPEQVNAAIKSGLDAALAGTTATITLGGK